MLAYNDTQMENHISNRYQDPMIRTMFRRFILNRLQLPNLRSDFGTYGYSGWGPPCGNTRCRYRRLQTLYVEWEQLRMSDRDKNTPRPVSDRFQGMLGYRSNEPLQQLTVFLFQEWTAFHCTVHVTHILEQLCDRIDTRLSGTGRRHGYILRSTATAME